MLKAVKKVEIRYNGKVVSLKKGEILDVTKEFGFIGREARGAELHIRDKYGLEEVQEKPEAEGDKE